MIAAVVRSPRSSALMSRLCRDDGHAFERAEALAAFDQRLDNLRRCVHWLIAAGIAVFDAELRRGQDLPKLTVAASPYLHTVFGDDRANISRRTEGGVTRSRWLAVRYDVLIEWEEVCA